MKDTLLSSQADKKDNQILLIVKTQQLLSQDKFVYPSGPGPWHSLDLFEGFDDCSLLERKMPC